MFEDATFDSRTIQRSQAPRWMALTLSLNLAVVAAMIVLPLVYPESLPTQLLQHALYVPAPPMARAAAQPEMRHAASSVASESHDLLVAPTRPPITISTEPVGPPPSAGPVDLGSGMSGGDVIGATGDRVFPSAQPVVRPAQPAVAKVSGGVLEGMLISKTMPVYPTIARTVGVSGTVVLAATISKEGTIVDLRVVSGHPMLTQAAMDAVRTWRYRPYLLNNQPVEVETTIDVVFSLAKRY